MRTTLPRALAASAIAAAAVGLSLTATSASAAPSHASAPVAASRTVRPANSPGSWYDVWIGRECRGQMWVENPGQDYVQGYIATVTPSDGGTAGAWVQCQGRVQISHTYGRTWRTVWDRTTNATNSNWAVSPRVWDGPGVRARVCVTEFDWGYRTATRCTPMW
jgi:hypothetical protein